MARRSIGYALLVISLAIIVGTAFNVYQVFSGQASPIDLFSSFSSNLETASGLGQNLSGQSSEGIIRSLNVFSHLFLAGFISSSAFKVGQLGVMMIRPIRVNLDQEKKEEKK